MDNEMSENGLNQKALMLGTLVQIFAWNITRRISSDNEDTIEAIENTRSVLLNLLNFLKISVSIPNLKSKDEIIDYFKSSFSRTIENIDSNLSLMYGTYVGKLFNFSNLSISYLLAVPVKSESKIINQQNIQSLSQAITNHAKNLNIDDSLVRSFLNNSREEANNLFATLLKHNRNNWLDIVEIKPGIPGTGISLDFKKVARFISDYWKEFMKKST